jgi:ATP phosphoribosyltransferase regulatory subunit HisZ
MAAAFPGVLLTIDLAEFARNGLDPRLTVAEGERPYYDGLVFHAYGGPAAVPVGGGGRYDRLFRALGAEVPAVGFSLSLERLLESAP